MTRAWWSLPAFIAAPVVIAALVGMAAQSGVDGWYQALEKPRLSPPDWAFPTVWTLLYAAMGASLWLFLRAANGGVARTGAILFAAQLAVNLSWRFVFFAANSIPAALGVIIVLMVLIAATIVTFSRASTWASTLLWPYLAWVAFASYLVVEIWRLN